MIARQPPGAASASTSAFDRMTTGPAIVPPSPLQPTSTSTDAAYVPPSTSQTNRWRSGHGVASLRDPLAATVLPSSAHVAPGGAVHVSSTASPIATLGGVAVSVT